MVLLHWQEGPSYGAAPRNFSCHLVTPHASHAIACPCFPVVLFFTHSAYSTRLEAPREQDVPTVYPESIPRLAQSRLTNLPCLLCHKANFENLRGQILLCCSSSPWRLVSSSKQLYHYSIRFTKVPCLASHLHASLIKSKFDLSFLSRSVTYYLGWMKGHLSF